MSTGSKLEGNSAWRSLSDDPGTLPGVGALKEDDRWPTALSRLGFRSAEEIKSAVERAKLDPVEVLRISIRQMRKSGCGRRGLPRAVIKRMYLDYLRLGSLQKVAKLYNRTRQSMWTLFKDHFLPMNDRNFYARILWGGEAWTPGKGGYYRPTSGDRARSLHKSMWESETGKAVPPGWQVTFRNGDNSDIRFDNLLCLPISEVTLFHYRRRFPDRANLDRGQRKQFWIAHNRRYMRVRAAGFKARGLRCDGKPLRRVIQKT